MFKRRLNNTFINTDIHKIFCFTFKDLFNLFYSACCALSLYDKTTSPGLMFSIEIDPLLVKISFPTIKQAAGIHPLKSQQKQLPP